MVVEREVTNKGVEIETRLVNKLQAAEYPTMAKRPAEREGNSSSRTITNDNDDRYYSTDYEGYTPEKQPRTEDDGITVLTIGMAYLWTHTTLLIWHSTGWEGGGVASHPSIPHLNNTIGDGVPSEISHPPTSYLRTV